MLSPKTAYSALWPLPEVRRHNASHIVQSFAEDELGARISIAIGDHIYKLDPIYTTRIFHNASKALRSSHPSQEYMRRNRTPPYVSAVPTVRHASLKQPKGHDGRTREHRTRYTHFLVLSSDGLCDLYEREHLSHRDTVAAIAKAVERTIRAEAVDGKTRNFALSLLRQALGGEDTAKVSRMLTVELQDRWMDDTTVIVQRL